MTEKETLQSEIKALEDQIAPKRERLHEIYRELQAEVEERIKQAHLGRGGFDLSELRFAAEARCNCGAGLAYPLETSSFGSWDCSDILRGIAVPKGQPDSKTHSPAKPFTFWEIKSEYESSVGQVTTRPSE